MKQQLDVEDTTTTSEEQMSADYLLLHTAFKAGKQQRRRLQVPSDADRRQSVPRIHVDDDGLDQPHRRTHSLKCSSSSSPTTRRQSASTCRRAVSVKSTPPRSARSISNASPKCRVSERDDYISRPLRRRSSATSAAAGGAGGGGCGRSAGSWKKLRRPRDVKQFRDEYGDLPPTADSQQRCTAARSLDDTINTTLEQLRLIQDGDCCVVRCFNTTANGLINRGDSFRRKNESLAHSSSTDGLPGGHDVISRSRSHSSTNSQASYAQLLAAAAAAADADDVDEVDDALPAGVQSSSSYTVLVLGQPGVGRTALLQQFMTSQFMAAETTRDSECDKTVSVLLNGLETTLSFVDLPLPVQKDCLLYSDIEAYLVVFSLTDRQSFRYACDVLRLLRHHSRTDAAVIVVGNKSDLVRGRRVSDDEARCMCRAMCCKYIQVSAALNHHVDDLLVGLVHQIRLNPDRQTATGLHSPGSDTPRCFSAVKDFFVKLVGKQPSSSFDCDDLWTL